MNSNLDLASSGRIEGNVFYRERIMLPPGAVVEVQLQDISKPDALASTLASVTLIPEAGPPYPFVLEYDADLINPSALYSIRATISDDGQLLFNSTEFIEPFTGSALEILVQSVPKSNPEAPLTLQGQTWTLVSLNGNPAATGAQGEPVTLLFSAEDGRASGFSGCNRYTGSYDMEGETEAGSALKFGLMASTLMACEEGAELERTYLQSLGNVTGYRIDGENLVLLSGDDEIATFRSS
ncbi:MAG: META domain-containing protein [Pseudomonadota bacterium]